jgi:hypothetical protein
MPSRSLGFDFKARDFRLFSRYPVSVLAEFTIYKRAFWVGQPAFAR